MQGRLYFVFPSDVFCTYNDAVHTAYVTWRRVTDNSHVAVLRRAAIFMLCSSVSDVAQRLIPVPNQASCSCTEFLQPGCAVLFYITDAQIVFSLSPYLTENTKAGSNCCHGKHGVTHSIAHVKSVV